MRVKQVKWKETRRRFKNEIIFAFIFPFARFYLSSNLWPVSQDLDSSPGDDLICVFAS